MDKLRVLIADDSQMIRFEISTLLEELGAEIVGEAENGQQAVELYQQLKPDLVTLDIIMPEKDGITALKEILAINPTAKVIMVSAMGDKKSLLTCLSAGAFDFIEKPFVAEKVKHTINNLLKVLNK
ncbi:MAG TPA: response regulator [bacterium]|nr:response regulator [bacterium]HPP88034.1 response regulator [bacterium]